MATYQHPIKLSLADIQMDGINGKALMQVITLMSLTIGLPDQMNQVEEPWGIMQLLTTSGAMKELNRDDATDPGFNAMC